MAGATTAYAVATANRFLAAAGTVDSPTQLYLAYFVDGSGPSDAGGGTEATGGGYARLLVAQGDFTVSGAAVMSNTAQFQFATASGGQGGEMGHWGIFDASSGGNLIIYGDIPLADKFTPVNNSIPTLPISAFQYDFNAN